MTDRPSLLGQRQVRQEIDAAKVVLRVTLAAERHYVVCLDTAVPRVVLPTHDVRGL